MFLSLLTMYILTSIKHFNTRNDVLVINLNFCDAKIIEKEYSLKTVG